jgi:hypothetical protein
MAGAFATLFVVVVIVGVTTYLVGTLARSIRNEKSTRMKLWKNFGLSIGFCALFFITWVAQATAEWQQFTDDQRAHGEPVEIGNFVSEFAQSTLENWQSEFLQLFSFTIMAAVLIHKGSAESKDSNDRIEASLLRIEAKLDTEPTSRGGATHGDLHVFPDEVQGWQLRAAGSFAPEGYYDTQRDAVAGGSELARIRGVRLLIHDTDGEVRDLKAGSQEG